MIIHQEKQNVMKTTKRNIYFHFPYVFQCIYLRILHMFVTILTDVFSHWFAHRANLGSISRGVITLLKEGGRDVWKKWDDDRPITLLNTELKNFARMLAKHLLIVVGHLIGPKQNYIVKEWSTQKNLHLMCEIIEGIEDDTNTVLTYLNLYKYFDRDEYRLMVTTRFKPEFCKWISILSAVIWISCENLWWGMQCRSGKLGWIFPNLHLSLMLRVNVDQGVKYCFSPSAVRLPLKLPWSNDFLNLQN